MTDRDIRALVFDIDGTLAMMDKDSGTYEALPGAVAALAGAKDMGWPVVAYTNGTFFPPAHYYPKLADAGLHLAPGHIMTPAVVAAESLKAMGHHRVMVMADDGIRVPLADAGIEIVEPVTGSGQVDAVMTGYTRNFDTDGLEAIVGAVWDGAKPFASSLAPFVASSKGKIVGIPGAIAAAIRHCTGEEVTVFGKPSVAGMKVAGQLTDVPAAQTAVIGDDPKLEIAMARRAGALAVGVTTGIADEAAFSASPEEDRADIVLPSLEDLMDKLGGA